MTQDNIPQDTPPQSTDNQEYTSLEEAVFGDVTKEGSQNISDVFTTGNEGNTEQAPVQGQPEVSVTEAFKPAQPEESDMDNDTKRYQYWQSQADKYKNELANIRKTTGVQEAPVVPQPTQEVPQQQVEEFPPAPERPLRPRTFSREEAYTDSSSESARYLDSKEDWDEQMVEYNTLRSQYQNAVLQEKFDKMENDRVAETQRHEAKQAATKQQEDILSYVIGHHGMNNQEANDFLTKMSDPSSITVDNLVQLYRMRNGGTAQQAAPATPSSVFTQTKNAQQVPSSMGVMPSGQANIDGRSFEDKVMDKMIGNFDSKNPWK